MAGRKAVPRPSGAGAAAVAAARREVLAGQTVDELGTASRKFAPPAATEKARLLQKCSTSEIRHPRVLIGYHDCLLFLLAYPQTAALREAAEEELRRVATVARELSDRASKYRRALEESGIAWSEIRVELSYPMARWLADRHPRQADVGLFGDEGVPLQSVLALSFGELEETLLARQRSSGELLEEVARDSGQSHLEWLVHEVGRLRCSEEIRDHLFLSLAVYVLIRPGDTALSRTFARGLPGRRFFHRRELERRVDLSNTLARPLPPSRRLSRNERLGVIDTARAVLAMLGRETEPISLCEPAGVDYLELERGVAIALYSPPPDRRPLDPQVGLFLFKNGMPVAYGGGWPFLDLCRIGIHIFEPYRGGESAHLFAQVLRVYHQRFGARRFVAEPTQFGAGDVDGLKSQAFWFYHRFGFRPTDPALHRLANAEAELRAADRSYRSPHPVLRRLARSNLELVLEGGDGPTSRCDPADLSLAVSTWIGEDFRGDRAAAEQAAFEHVRVALGVTDFEGWPESERRGFRSLCQLLAHVPDLGRWPIRDRRGMVAAMRAKGSPNLLPYFDLTRRHARFGRALAELVEVNRQGS